MKKLSCLFGSLIALTTSLAFAEQNENQLLRQPQSQKPEAMTAQPKSSITPAVAPIVLNGVGLIVSADFIWWKTNISGMEYATNGVVDGGDFVRAGASAKRGHVAQPDFDFEPGIKVGMGLDFSYDGWDLTAEYTWLHSGMQRNSLSAHRGSGAIDLLPAVFSDGDFESTHVAKASSRWNQHFNVLDLELGRNFFISRRLTLRPHLGLKNAWISEYWRVKSVVAEGSDRLLQRRKQSLWGMGTRAGLDTVWHFSRNWGLYGDIAVTALWSDFHIRARDKDGRVKTFNTREVITEVIPVLETGIGITYMTWFNDEDCAFQVSAGWEEQVWLGFNNFVNSNRTGNLSLHGLTAKAAIAF